MLCYTRCRAMDFARLKTLYNRCNPDEQLPVGDERYVDLDGRGVRGTDWVARLARPIEMSDLPTCQLFTGLPGSGKSTELLRLATRLGEREGANQLAVLINAEDTLDLLGELDETDILLMIVDGCTRAVLEAEGHPDVEQAMAEGFFKRLWHWVTRTDVEFQSLQLNVGEVGKLSAELKTRSTLRQRFRKTVGANFNRFMREVRDELEVLQGRANQLGRAGLVVIVDSLEKLRGTGTTWNEVLVSAEKVFDDDGHLRRLPIHSLFTIPPALVSRQRFASVSFMPMIKLHKHPRDGGERYEPGYDAAMQLLLERASERELAELFGAQTEARLERLIEWSGGYPREIVRLLREALASPSLPLSEHDFNRILNEVRDAYHKLLKTDDLPWLAQVAVTRYLTNANDGERQTADVMLSNNVVLRYLNEWDWFDVHPAVRQIPVVAEAIAAIEAARAAEAST